MYPSTIMTLNISPEMKIGKLDGWDAKEFIKNTQKGIVEIIEDVKSLLYNKHKLTRFGLKNVDWQFNGVTDPTLTSLQPLLLSPYIEAKQINLRVNVIENRNVNQLGST